MPALTASRVAATSRMSPSTTVTPESPWAARARSCARTTASLSTYATRGPALTVRAAVRVRLGGHAGAQVDELRDPLPGRPSGGPGEELPVLAHHVGRDGDHGEQLLRDFPVDGEIVLAVQQVVINPGDGRRSGIKVGHGIKSKRVPDSPHAEYVAHEMNTWLTKSGSRRLAIDFGPTQFLTPRHRAVAV